MANISDAFMTNVTSRMRGASMADLVTSDGGSESEEEPTTAPKRKILKLGMVRTSDSSVLHKVAWPHEVSTPQQVSKLNMRVFPHCYSSVDTWLS